MQQKNEQNLLHNKASSKSKLRNDYAILYCLLHYHYTNK